MKPLSPPWRATRRLLTSAALALLAGCASQQALVPQVRSQATGDGGQSVSVAPERLTCQAGPGCPQLSARWLSGKKGLAQLTIYLPGTQAEITGADVMVGGGETLRLRSRVASADTLPGHVASSFDVPLRVIDRIAYGSRPWMRVYTADGRQVDESIDSGEQRSRAAEAMAYFLQAVQSAGGSGAALEGARGGLLDRLGGGK